MLRIWWTFAAALGVALAPALARAQAQPTLASFAQAPLYVVVPFGEPGDTDPVLANATRQFSEDLADRQVRSTLGTPTDAVEAVANAQTICAQYSAAGILISSMRFAQTNGFNVPAFVTGFVPYVGGVISGAGVLDRLPIKAQYKLYLVDCRGKVTWRTVTTASKVHHGNNLAAGMTEIGLKAVAEAADQFAARRSQAH
jgi:hypothetical protein